MQVMDVAGTGLASTSSDKFDLECKPGFTVQQRNRVPQSSKTLRSHSQSKE